MRSARPFVNPTIVAFAAFVSVAGAAMAGSAPAPSEQAHAARVTITRDDHGIAHVHGRTDADAVFGMIYAQAEDDFPRIERNYLVSLGRLSESEGESAIWQDLRQRLFLKPENLQHDYRASPPWLKSLMQAWADGLNYYLATHPDAHPSVLAHFEPWMALSFTEGSIGGDIETAPLSQLQAFYEKRPLPLTALESGMQPQAPRGSNGFAIAPSHSSDGHALLYINPHTSFYFRSELQMSSDQGLNAYGAVTWGQFFVYQGFNQHAGWMHTSSTVDSVDEFAETIVPKDGKIFYRYGAELREVRTNEIVLRYRAKSGDLVSRRFVSYHTHHGPIIREEQGKWIALALMNKPIAALEQSYLRTKASDFAGFMKVAELKANSSNNTIFADDTGEIAYLHPQFVPIRDDRFDYTKPVDGSDPTTDWRGVHSLQSLPQVVDPTHGWVMNTNGAPWSASGPDSPRKADYPKYMATNDENTRGLHAVMVLDSRSTFDLQSLIDAGYDSYLPAFGRLVPRLLAAYDKAPDPDLHDQVELLRRWDCRWAIDSIQTTIAVAWGDTLWKALMPDATRAGVYPFFYILDHVTDAQLIAALKDGVLKLQNTYGDWRIPWGDINRLQRLDDGTDPRFDDKKPSLPVPFTSARWGSLASFETQQQTNTKKYYGVDGNTFVAAVDFGPRVRALAITVGGESGDPASPHFTDQNARYAMGQLRPVYFYPKDIQGHTEAVYHPGGRTGSDTTHR
jgi:acyl-homoserine-lactone acylase